LHFFTSYEFCAAQLASFAIGMVTLVEFYFISIFYVLVNQLTGASAGAQLTYFAPGLGVGSLISMIRPMQHPKYPIVAGLAIITIALGLISRALEDGRTLLVSLPMVLAGVGIGLAVRPLYTFTRSLHPSTSQSSLVLAIAHFCSTLGGTVGIAQCSIILNATVRSYLADLFAQGVVSSDEIDSLVYLSSTSLEAINNLPPDLAVHVRNAFRYGTHWAFVGLIPYACIACILAFFIPRRSGSAVPGKDAEKEATAHHDALIVYIPPIGEASA